MQLFCKLKRKVLQVLQKGEFGTELNGFRIMNAIIPQTACVSWSAVQLDKSTLDEFSSLTQFPPGTPQ